MSGVSQDIVRRLIDLERQVAEMKRMTRPYTAVRARIYGSTQAIPNLTGTPLIFDDDRWSTAFSWDTSDPTRLTCTVAGLYDIGANVQWAANATGNRRILIRANGTTAIADVIANAVTTAATPTHQNIGTHYELAVGDYVEVLVQQTSGGPLNINGVTAYSPEFWMTRIV
jgi:hypothetical protein